MPIALVGRIIGVSKGDFDVFVEGTPAISRQGTRPASTRVDVAASATRNANRDCEGGRSNPPPTAAGVRAPWRFHDDSSVSA